MAAIAAAMAGCHRGAAPAPPPATTITPSHAQPVRLSWKRAGDIGWYEAEVVFGAKDTAVTWKSYADPRKRFNKSAAAGTALWDQLLQLGILELPDVHYTGKVMDGFPQYDVDVAFRLKNKKKTKHLEINVRGAQEGDPRYLQVIAVLERFAQLPAKRRLRLPGSDG